MLQSLRGTGSRLQSYNFDSYPDCITAKVAFESQVSSLWEEAHALENFANSTDRPEDLEAFQTAKMAAIQKGNEWMDYTKQAERHFGQTVLTLQFFSVVANIISNTADVPDEIALVKESAKQFRNGKQSKSGRVFGSMQFNSISHYMRFSDECVAVEDALKTIPAYKAFTDEVTKG